MTDNNEVWGYSAGYGIECDHEMTVDIWPLGGRMNPGLFCKIEIDENASKGEISRFIIFDNLWNKVKECVCAEDYKRHEDGRCIHVLDWCIGKVDFYF